MTTEKKKIPINNHHAEPAGVRGEGPETGTSGVAADAFDPSAAFLRPAGRGGPESSPGDDRGAGDGGLGTGSGGPAGGSPYGAGAERVEEASERTPLEAVTAERDAYLDALRRLQAEFDNYRRRSQRESGEARSRARCGLLSEFLPVFDNLTRALDAAEHHEEGKVLGGVRLTHALFADLLRREGVEEIHPLGSPFDPTLHEAIASLPSEEAEGTVISVAEKGYTAGETVLRPARVAVSAGPGGGSTGSAEE